MVKEIIGSKIKHYRTKQKITQEDLATLINTDRQYVCKIEKGKINISLDYLEEIIQKLNVQETDFFPDNNH